MTLLTNQQFSEYLRIYSENTSTQIPATMATQLHHPQTLLDDELQSMYGNARGGHVRWKTWSTGPPNSPTRHASVYVDGMNHGTASADTETAARDEAALRAYNSLRHERLRIHFGNTSTQIPATMVTQPQPPHPRTRLNNVLQSMYGNAKEDHVRWEIWSTGPPNSPMWHASVYIDDMSHGTASAVTKGAAQNEAARQALDNLARGY